MNFGAPESALVPNQSTFCFSSVCCSKSRPLCTSRLLVPQRTANETPSFFVHQLTLYPLTFCISNIITTFVSSTISPSLSSSEDMGYRIISYHIVSFCPTELGAEIQSLSMARTAGTLELSIEHPLMLEEEWMKE
jgi:hypothetical protein